ncbi:MFS general substrate transporter [Gloeophyllum trabeum ATCC 11539]|uniref:MFS general substrate transporter n=1 Tax=Gloeophyllum trabeum (strain ATCC 11539 / FP-39264 / Madison 617) TaxID=670483 RepID=S7PUX1_GLOTA|nr:MFS general substrate transporter [Gloeophyllum trabeum ATCC 11539]EPQ51107.1 MFS general substrate transporter [Gloeophyllum trabeum ATCC 11539]
MPDFINLRTLKPPSVETVTLAARQPLPASTSTITISEDQEAGGSESGSTDGNGTVLAPIDNGFGAWSFLVAAFFVEAIVWGFPNSFGVFLASYLNDPRYALQKDSSSLLPLVGTLSSGIMYCSGPVIHTLTGRRPYFRRPLLWFGTFLCWASLFGASYATKVNQLVVLQGVLYAVGGSFLYHPCISYMSEWFVARRGLANGVMFAGTGAGGLLLPLILPPLLNKFGASSTLRILSIAILCMLVPLLPFVKGRLPESRVHGPNSRATERTWMKNKVFWIVLIANTIQGFAYFIPIIWLPTFATELHINSTESSLAIALLNGGSVCGRVAMGVLSDRLDPWLLGSFTLLSTSLATFVLWGVLSRNLAGLLAYGLAYGGLAGGWSSLWTGFVRPIAKDDPTLSTYIFGLLMLSRGLGNIVSTPISTSLSQGYPTDAMNGQTGFGVAGGRFEKMIIYVGTCFVGAAVVALAGWGMEKSRPRRT